jgi:phage shock protein PspC (stress-responsive transcriptional regulator)
MSDQETTQQMPAPQPPPDPGGGARPRRLTRGRDRMLAGVASGLGDYFNVDPLIIRIAFAVSVFIGGLGVVAYVALALFVPAEEADGTLGEAPIERSRGLAIGAGIGLAIVALSWGLFEGPWDGGWFFSPFLLIVALVAAAVLIVQRPASAERRTGVLGSVLFALFAVCALSVLALGAAWAGATGHGAAVAAGVVGIGVLLVVAAFTGGARWLIVPAVAVAVPLGMVTAADVSFGDGVGEREYRPTTVASIPAAGYELGIGQLVVDLRDLDWQPGMVLELDTDLGIGQAVVGVPSDVCVTHDVLTRAGTMRVAGTEQDGVDVRSVGNVGAEATPRLELTGEVDLGEMVVLNDDDADLTDDRGRWDWGGANGEQMRADLLAACATQPDEPPARARGGAGG